MVRIAIVGTGYVGLVTGTCLAESGNTIVCIDVNHEKIRMLNAGEVPLFEPGLAELLERNRELGRLKFTTEVAGAIAGCRCVFIAVGTPQHEDGSANLTNLWAAIESLAPHLERDQIVVIKSTVPIGTNAAVAQRLSHLTSVPVHVASNPEFLKEGAAILDFTKPDRVVVGVREPRVAQVLLEIHAPFLRTEHPFLIMTPESAELTKYAANAMLATKISFINEIANLCERTGADIKEVRRGIGHDSRIGFAFTFPGVGYGGSCFPKDVRALAATSRAVGASPRILDAVDRVNEAQKKHLFAKIDVHFQGRLSGLTLAVWGLAFKPCTDDIREAPALVLLDQLLERGVHIQVHDPVAMEQVRARYGDRLTYCIQPYAALERADGLVVVTEWSEFRTPDFQIMKRAMNHPVIFDGRNLYEEAPLRKLGFTYYYVGQPNPVQTAGELQRAA